MGAPPGARRIEYRPAIAVDAPVLSDIAFRAKTHWGYDEAFMSMRRAALTITPARWVRRNSKTAGRKDNRARRVPVLSRWKGRFEPMLAEPA